MSYCANKFLPIPPYTRRAALEHRRGQDSKQNDMLKLLMDLQDSAKEARQEMNNNGEDEQFETDAKLSGVTKAAVIDEDTVTQSAVLFLIAGIDTTAHTLSIVAYYLAINPDVQEMARKEADSIADALEDGNITYDDVKKYSIGMLYIFSFLISEVKFACLLGWNTLTW